MNSKCACLVSCSFWSRCHHPAILYLAKAAFSKHHQEVKIGQFHPVPVPVVVKFGYGVSRLFFRSLGPLIDLGPLEGEAHRKHHQSLRMPLYVLKLTYRPQAVAPAARAPSLVKSMAQLPQCRPKMWRPALAPHSSFIPRVSSTTRNSHCFLPAVSRMPSSFHLHQYHLSSSLTWTTHLGSLHTGLYM